MSLFPQNILKILTGIKRIWQRFYPQIQKQKWLLVAGFLGLVMEVLARLLVPIPLKLIFDYIIVPGERNLPFPVSFLPQTNTLLLLTIFTLGIVGATGLQAAAAYVSSVSMSVASSRIITEIRAQLYAHLQRLSLSFHNQAKSGDLITRITGDTGRLKEIMITAGIPLLVNNLTLLGMLGVMLWLNWELTIIALTVFPLFLLTTLKITRRIHGLAKQQRKREGAMAALTAEAMGAIKVVQALSLEEMLQDSFSDQNRKSLQEGVKTQQLAASLQRTIQILIAIAQALVIWRGVQLVQQQVITPGDLLIFITYLKTFFKPSQKLAKQTTQISKAVASADRVMDLLDTVPDIRDNRGAMEAPAFRGKVSFNQVSFGYKSDHSILNNLNFEAQPGEKVALVGPSGGGKSTLVSLLLRLYDPDEGNICIDGHDLREYKLESLRRQITIVLQDSVLFGVNVRDNISYGLLGASDREIEAAARLANAHDFIMRLPQGYDTILGERGESLSGGQRQRIAIARAAIRKAPIVILDEPTVGLDNENERSVSEALERLTQGCTTFLITHDLRTAISADRILYIERGEILEQGTHQQLISLGGRYATLYRLQSVVDGSRVQNSELGVRS
ncbi:MAG: ABC transporter ATP-binding protein [Xenococcus sp. (in: cyanobacteria)]